MRIEIDPEEVPLDFPQAKRVPPWSMSEFVILLVTLHC